MVNSIFADSVGIKYLCVICIGWQTAVFYDMDEIVDEYVEY